MGDGSENQRVRQRLETRNRLFELSIEVAVTSNWKSVSLPGGGVTVRAARFHPRISTSPSSAVAVKTFTPSDNVAPSGIADITNADRVSEPSVSVTDAATSSAIALSWTPVAAPTSDDRALKSTSGASATASTVTSMAPTVDAVLPPSVAVAVTVKGDTQIRRFQ